MTEQARSLARRSHVVVSTPGRLVDHIRSSSNAVDLSRLKVVVLDEADRLLGAAFATEMKVIFGACNPARQTLLFSATMSANLSRLQKIAMNGAFVFDATPAELRDAEGGGWKTPACLQQQYMFMPAKVTETYLVYLLLQLEGSSVIVFTSSRGSCNMLFMTLPQRLPYAYGKRTVSAENLVRLIQRPLKLRFRLASTRARSSRTFPRATSSGCLANWQKVAQGTHNQCICASTYACQMQIMCVYPSALARMNPSDRRE